MVLWQIGARPVRQTPITLVFSMLPGQATRQRYINFFYTFAALKSKLELPLKHRSQKGAHKLI